MEAMRKAKQQCLLIRIDDAHRETTNGKAAGGSKSKGAFVDAMEMRGCHPKRLRLDAVAGFTFATLGPWALEVLGSVNCVTSDCLLEFEVLRQLDYRHAVRITPRSKIGTEIEPFKCLNIMLDNLKTALSDTYLAFKFARYAQRYLVDVQYRLDRRFDLVGPELRLAKDFMRAKPCTRSRIIKPNRDSNIIRNDYLFLHRIKIHHRANI
ncbi:transposase [Vogesella facilis]|uniref:Transposase n=1 Tax=Vogesella facilis TaxID=1655232 RepID=A0ABV7REM2_9NEIS